MNDVSYISRKRFGIHHLFEDKEYSCREIKSHLKKQLSQFKTAQNNIQKAKNSFLYVLEGVTDFGVTKIVVKKVYIIKHVRFIARKRFCKALQEVDSHQLISM